MSQFVEGITPGPRQRADLESFFHPIAEELNILAEGVSGVTVAGFEQPQVVRGLDVQFTTDMPGEDKMLKAVGHHGELLGKFRVFGRVRAQNWYWFPPYDPPYGITNPPPAKRRGFDVLGKSTPRRGAASVAASAVMVKCAREAGQTKAAVRALEHKKSFKDSSLFVAPSPANKARYLALKYLWDIGPDVLPYDTMHLFLCNAVRRLWELLAGENDKLGDDQRCFMPKSVREAVGQEIEDGRPTVPLSQARQLRDIETHSGSHKAVDWMYFLLSVGQVVWRSEFLNIF